MPWITLPFTDRKAKNTLMNMFVVNEIPKLVFVNSDGSTINANGAAIVTSDPDGTHFP